MTDAVPDAGLTSGQAAKRRQAGQANVTSQRSSRSVWSIVESNVLTRFNAIIGALLVVVLVFGQPQDGLFGLVIVVNSAVGIIQELRAKRTLDALTLLERADVRVRRDGTELAIAPAEVVVDDLILLSIGEKVPVDGEVVATSGLEIDESLLTGEADSVRKRPGDNLLSGSFVVAGSGAFVANRIGDEAYANQVVAQARTFELARSELMTGINRILRWVTWAIVPVGALLVVSQLSSTDSLAQALVGSVAGIVPMVPEGLVLLTSVAFAVGVIRLGQRRCLVQELPAVEVLARVDVLCLDKTGTLTAPELELDEITFAQASSASQIEQARAALAALATVDTQANPTVRAIAAAVPMTTLWKAGDTIAFSSTRKYSAATFDDHGSWVLGAPDVILADGEPQRARAEAVGATGRRVLALGRLPEGGLSHDGPLAAVVPAALVVLRQRLRPEAAKTLEYLEGEGVAVKILSGDNAASVGAVAAALHVPGADDPVDARDLPEDPTALGREIESHSVFGRVTPEQKRAFVTALRTSGHTVAMTGDGVNDALALKDADLGIAMGSGSPATRAVAKVVLLDDSFGSLPYVLAEGRRVLGNIERVASLFLVKTVYSLVLAVMVGAAHIPFPFLPRHVTLVGSLTIGIPGFFLALAPNTERARPGFVARVLRFAAPAGLICAVAAFVSYGLARVNTSSDQVADRSAATLTLFLTATCVLALVARPYTWWRVALLTGVLASFAAAGWVSWLATFFALSFGDFRNNALAVIISAVGGAAILLLHRLLLHRAPASPTSQA